MPKTKYSTNISVWMTKRNVLQLNESEFPARPTLDSCSWKQPKAAGMYGAQSF